jgi:hypothetical protein
MGVPISAGGGVAICVEGGEVSRRGAVAADPELGGVGWWLVEPPIPGERPPRVGGGDGIAISGAGGTGAVMRIGGAEPIILDEWNEPPPECPPPQADAPVTERARSRTAASDAARVWDDKGMGHRLFR